MSILDDIAYDMAEIEYHLSREFPNYEFKLEPYPAFGGHCNLKITVIRPRKVSPNILNKINKICYICFDDYFLNYFISYAALEEKLNSPISKNHGLK